MPCGVASLRAFDENAGDYDTVIGRVTALTLVDASEGMLDKARVKARKHVHANGIGRVSLLCASAQSLPFEDGTFDTVVDTFGLCSMDDPESVLRELGRVCKPGGKVLLLEHGLGTWEFINRMLEKGAQRHLAKWGCQYNRDIAAIVRRSGLLVERSQRWHFGTTHVYVCRPQSAADALSGAEADEGT